MANYSIPNDFLNGFKLLKSLPVESVDKIAESLKSIPIGGGRKAFVDAIGSVIPDIDSIEIVAVAIHSMGRLISIEDADFDKISKGLAVAYFKQTNSQSTKDSLEDLSGRIFKLLQSWTNAKKSFKALKLFGRNKNIYKRGHIISDIRLLFDEDLTSKSRHALIIHQLALEYIVDDNETKEFYIALDNNSLLKLKEQINRALEKEQNIKESYGTEIDFISLIKD